MVPPLWLGMQLSPRNMPLPTVYRAEFCCSRPGVSNIFPQFTMPNFVALAQVSNLFPQFTMLNFVVLGQECLFPGAKVPGNFCSWERRFPLGTFDPRNENTGERKVLIPLDGNRTTRQQTNSPTVQLANKPTCRIDIWTFWPTDVSFRLLDVAAPCWLFRPKPKASDLDFRLASFWCKQLAPINLCQKSGTISSFICRSGAVICVSVCAWLYKW